MPANKRTPGPWVWEYRDGRHPLNDQDGWGTYGLWAVNGGLILGSEQGWDGGFSGPEPADAALIAAAPDYHLAATANYGGWIGPELLDAAADHCDDSAIADLLRARATADRAAIAKAKGGAR